MADTERKRGEERLKKVAGPKQPEPAEKRVRIRPTHCPMMMLATPLGE
jgi:hypothetical protein